LADDFVEDLLQVLAAALGTFETSTDVRYMAAFGGILLQNSVAFCGRVGL
jgi:hypothetical protein